MTQPSLEISTINITTSGLLERLSNHQAQVSILILNKENKWILGQKPNFYPKGKVRLLGGGVDEGEDYLTAAQRELEEETGVKVEKGKLVPLIQLDVCANSTTGQKGFASFPVFLLEYDGELTPSDDVKGLAYLDDVEMRELIEAFQNLPETPVDGEEPFTWSDYGKIWSVIHELSLNKARTIA